MGARRLNPRRARIHRSYTVGEIAVLFAVHRNTVRAWLAGGLVSVGPGKPLLVHGAELRRFLTARRAAQRRPCGAGKLYCLPCRAPRKPDGDIAEFNAIGQGAGNLSAICDVCGGIMNRRIRVEGISVEFPGIEVQIRQAEPRLVSTSAPSPNCDIRLGVKA